jgi:4-hydroxysphinganine ceramide fatty acyl 2-hydroxylase
MFKNLVMSVWNYYFSFVTDTAIGCGIVLFGLLPFSNTGFTTPMYFGAGIVAFTLIEYCVHRFIFHLPKSPAYRSHMIHHSQPKKLVALPFFIPGGIALTFWALFPSASIFIGSLLLGHFLYGLIHHAEHHFPRFHHLKQYHDMHH